MNRPRTSVQGIVLPTHGAENGDLDCLIQTSARLRCLHELHFVDLFVLVHFTGLKHVICVAAA